MQSSNIRYLIISGLFTALTAIGAFIKMPFYPVPFTLQTFMTAFAGLMLPPRWAALSQLVYLLLGLLGAPVFANGGGLEYVLRPTFGYLLLLPPAAALISCLQRRYSPQSVMSIFYIVLPGLFVVLAGGGVWLYFNLRYVSHVNVAFFNILLSGVLLFFPGMLVKAAMVAVFKFEFNKRMK